jgi:hypothetical protein
MDNERMEPERMESEQMENEIKPTWRLAWGLWWRMVLIGLGIGAIIWLILYLVDITLTPSF